MEAQNSKYPDIVAVAPLSDSDHECLGAIREVLLKYGNLSRFGLTLLHQHFAIGDDEVLLETCNAEDRTLTLKPVKKHSLANANIIETSWELREGDLLQGCISATEERSASRIN